MASADAIEDLGQRLMALRVEHTAAHGAAQLPDANADNEARQLPQVGVARADTALGNPLAGEVLRRMQQQGLMQPWNPNAEKLMLQQACFSHHVFPLKFKLNWYFILWFQWPSQSPKQFRVGHGHCGRLYNIYYLIYDLYNISILYYNK